MAVSSRRPRRPSVAILEDRDALAAALAAWAAEALTLPGDLLALAVGESTLPLYRSLPASDAWGAKRIIALDELLPPPADATRTFTSKLRAALPPALRDRVVPIAVEPDPAARAADLAGLTANAGLCGAVLGLGPDGHVAFNQPGSDADACSRVVALDDENLRRLGDVAPARAAITLGLAEIRSARRLALVAAGEGKEEALRRVVDGPAGADAPVSLLRDHEGLSVLVLRPLDAALGATRAR